MSSTRPSAPASSAAPTVPEEAPSPGARPSDAAREALRRATAAAKAAGAGAAEGTGVRVGESAGSDAYPDAATDSDADSDPETDPAPGTDAGARVRDVGDVPLPVSDGAAEAGSGQRPARPAEISTEPAEVTEPPSAGRSGAGTAGGARPGDIAREALRAARDEARRVRTEGTEGKEGDGGGATEAAGKGVGPRRRSARTSSTGSRGRRSPVDPANTDRESRARELRDLLAGAFQLPPDVAAVTGHPAHPADTGAAHPADATGEAIRDRGHGEPAHPAAESDTGAATDAFTSGSLGPEPSTTDSFATDSFAPGPLRPGSLDPAFLHGETSHPESPTVRPTPSEFAPGTAREATPGPRRAHPAPHSPADAHTPFGRPAAAVPAERLPRSMASPGRDGELRRTFPRFPARVPEADAFAETWWGNAWVGALEEGALDAARLARGRRYAGQGYVDAITVTPGLVLAYVHGSRPRPYRVQVRVRTLADDDWDRFLDAAAERPGHIAALLDKEMPRSLADCGVDLLPGPGELEPHCSCPDFGHPCKHAAALCYQMARLLDQDPFVLLLLRGRGERELLDALSRRNAARAARAAQEREPAPLPGVRARDAVARRVLPPLPAPLPPPAHPEQPPTYPGAPGGPDPFALDQLATDAAARAHALLTSGRDPVAELTLWQDAVRIAAARPGSGLTAATRALYSSLASATGRTPADLARAVAAWRQGGFEALSVLEEPWDPPAGRFDRARPLLLAADLPAFRPWRNHLTHPRGDAQLRLGRNGLWYAYESEPGHDDWWPRGTPDLDPVGALTGLGAPGEF
ncbi:SWIM zinc finger family protein [Streptomyces sp. NBC_00645]|uniref:SWIM zinc finger family protein n=1 Tax=Streptomyces sp. NBC_00645 TaxID=2975795 RepID=UPI0038655864